MSWGFDYNYINIPDIIRHMIKCGKIKHMWKEKESSTQIISISEQFSLFSRMVNILPYTSKQEGYYRNSSLKLAAHTQSSFFKFFTSNLDGVFVTNECIDLC